MTADMYKRGEGDCQRSDILRKLRDFCGIGAPSDHNTMEEAARYIEALARPVRLQLSRKKGFDLQALSRAINGLEAVNVARPSKWGNPFVVGQPSGIFDGKNGRSLGIREEVEILIPSLTLDQAIEFYRDVVNGIISPEMYPHGHDWRSGFLKKSENWWPGEMARSTLCGKNLACYCEPSLPCHADILLELANADASRRVKEDDPS